MSQYKDNAREAFRRGYWVDGDGVVCSSRGVRKVNRQKNGLSRFSLHRGNPQRRVNVLVHHLAALTLFGDAAFADGVSILHLDRNRENNSAENLALGTQTEAQYLIPRHERVLYAMNAASKLRRLTVAQVHELRAMRETGASLKQICARFEIAKSTASYIVNRKTYN